MGVSENRNLALLLEPSPGSDRRISPKEYENVAGSSNASSAA